MTGLPCDPPILVTGATGYIGGRLVPRLLERGHRVRCLVRTPKKLSDRPWAKDPRVEILACDLADGEQTASLAKGCSAAFYLVHSMLAAGSDYVETDNDLARNFARAAEAAELKRIVYLGGLGETGAGLSEHLASRRQVEAELGSGTVPVTVLRAAMIIGSGSASFEILRYLVERLPIMVTPRWVRTRCQPIGVNDVLHYLVACLDTVETIGQTLDIGGPDVLTYQAVMQQMAQSRGLPRRIIVPLPVLTPRLSSLWIHLVTPMSAKIARPLAEGLRNEVVCRDSRATHCMPSKLATVREAIELALGREAAGSTETRWSDTGAMPSDPDWAGGTTFVDPRTVQIQAPAAAVFAAICRVGGGHGWYAGDWLWKLRGWMDKLVGGPGLRRGRRNPERVAYGEALDFWRVTCVEKDRALELRAEMKLPGVATLSFEVSEVCDISEVRDTTERGAPKVCTLTQTARFRPKGLLGILYWYSVLPLHGFVFRGMLRGIARAATRIATGHVTGPALASAAPLGAGSQDGSELPEHEEQPA